MMGKGFGTAKAKQDKSAAQQPELTPIDQIQADLSDCFTEIKDPRVDRTKKHLLKDISKYRTKVLKIEETQTVLNLGR